MGRSLVLFNHVPALGSLFTPELKLRNLSQVEKASMISFSMSEPIKRPKETMESLAGSQRALWNLIDHQLGDSSPILNYEDGLTAAGGELVFSTGL